MLRINTGISIDETVLKGVDDLTERTGKINKIRWSRSQQIELILAEKLGLVAELIKPYQPQPIDAKRH